MIIIKEHIKNETKENPDRSCTKNKFVEKKAISGTIKEVQKNAHEERKQNQALLGLVLLMKMHPLQTTRDGLKA